MTGVFINQKQNFRGASFVLPLLFMLVLGSVMPVGAQSEGPNQAGLVVIHGDGLVITRCVSFTESEISGLDLLQRSGLAWQASNGPMGSTVCALDGEGCAASDCFCKCKQAPCAYWNYYTGSGDGAWLYSGIGAAARALKNGDVDAWVWGDGSAGPPNLAFSSICSAGVAPPPNNGGATATLQPTTAPAAVEVTATPEPLPSATPAATETPAVSQTATPTATPTRDIPPSATDTPAPTPTASSTPLPPTPTQEMTPEPTATAMPTQAPDPTAELAGEKAAGTPLTQIGPFVLLIGVLAGSYFTLRRRK